MHDSMHMSENWIGNKNSNGARVRELHSGFERAMGSLACLMRDSHVEKFLQKSHRY